MILQEVEVAQLGMVNHLVEDKPFQSLLTYVEKVRNNYNIYIRLCFFLAVR